MARRCSLAPTPSHPAASTADPTGPQSGIWPLFHFESPQGAEQMLHAQAAIRELKPFEIAMAAGGRHSCGGWQAGGLAGGRAGWVGGMQVGVGGRGATSGCGIVSRQRPVAPGLLLQQGRPAL